MTLFHNVRSAKKSATDLIEKTKRQKLINFEYFEKFDFKLLNFEITLHFSKKKVFLRRKCHLLTFRPLDVFAGADRLPPPLRYKS